MNMFRRTTVAALLIGASTAAFGQAPEPVDEAMVAKIRELALQDSQVMTLLGQLAGQIGPRLTGSPGMAQANDWSRGMFNAWGLADVHDEQWGSLGAGWQYTASAVDMLAPRATSLHAIPLAWSAGTSGPVTGVAVRVKLNSAEDRDRHRGTLRGKIVLMNDSVVAPRAGSGAAAAMHAEEPLDLNEMAKFSPSNQAERRLLATEFLHQQRMEEDLQDFLVDEGVLATLYTSTWRNGIIRNGSGRPPASPLRPGVPKLMLPAEHYNSLLRSLAAGVPVTLRVNVSAAFSDADIPSSNTLAEIRGSSHANEIVMLGAHLDSWHSATGASDNAAGVAVVMEAMRILKTLDVKPKRTIRVALWSGEEQGLYGSAAYVAAHFMRPAGPVDASAPQLPPLMRSPSGRTEEGAETLSAYFNMDNGSGRFQGIHAQGNTAAMAIFEAWLRPFHDLGASEVTPQSVGGTDHVSFDRVGLPGFQFKQDWKDYLTHVHHSHLDTTDHVDPADLQQAAAIMASFVYHAAMREAPFPRKP